MLSPFTRTCAIFLENKDIGSGLFIREIAATLRKYADDLDSGTADYPVYCATSEGGTKLTALGGAYDETGHNITR